MNLNTEKIAVVVSQFNKEIAQRLEEGALSELKKAGYSQFELVKVPGVVEIPLTAKWLFEQGAKVVIALGTVIRGETSHYNACCRLVEQGTMQVQLKMNRPLIFGILMTDNKAQALARTGGTKGHIAKSAVQTALEMLKVQTTFRPG